MVAFCSDELDEELEVGELDVVLWLLLVVEFEVVFWPPAVPLDEEVSWAAPSVAASSAVTKNATALVMRASERFELNKNVGFSEGYGYPDESVSRRGA